MSSNRHRRDDYYDGVDRYRNRRRSRSRSRTPERYRRRRSPDSRSRSRSRDRSYGRYGSHGDKRSSRYMSSSSRRQSGSRSRSKSRTRQSSKSHSPSSYNRPTTSNNSRPAYRSEQKFEKSSQRHIAENQNNKKGSSSHERDNSKSPYAEYSVENLPLPKKEAVGAYYNLNTEEPIDKERIHREMEEKLRAALAKEGKVYPPPKPEPSHPVFANDGSFIEIFKKMQQAQHAIPAAGIGIIKPVTTLTEATTSTAAAYVAATAAGKPAPPPPIVGRRRGGKILKTGMVAKPKAQGEDTNDPKDFWTIYLREVNKYKNNACESDTGNRPLVK